MIAQEEARAASETATATADAAIAAMVSAGADIIKQIRTKADRSVDEQSNPSRSGNNPPSEGSAATGTQKSTAQQTQILVQNASASQTGSQFQSSLFDGSDSCDLTIDDRLERERDASFELLRRQGAVPLR